ncbi:type I restriction enzyme S subunit [Desulfomicrobium macestii]|uniref:Type I restriction enzyme S subunit n=1 Tax=Desulfomicrobium macestii TaxID=90731 RepID=A0ABR9H9F8_9BACT|nr:hypothetical protein [Desulfomicrobium macestii]MBE1427371.1 type I restriction enzyme S subunit [Desulfomicrobium macestii]
MRNIAAYSTYDSYKDSGVEWIGQIPSHWSVKRAGFILEELSERSKDGSEPLLSLSKIHGVIRRDSMAERGGQADSLVGYKMVSKDDIVVNRMQASNGLMAISRMSGITSPDYAIYRVKRNVPMRADVVAALLQQVEYQGEIKRRVKGVMEGFIRLYSEDLFRLPLICAPLPEQRAIAVFLDEKCAKLDEAVRIKEQQIALLRERRQILIQQTVTHGLNPVAPMKDSGIGWIGQVPAHWEVRRSKYVFTQRKELARKDDIQLSATQSYGVIPQEEFEELVGRRVVKIQTNLEKRKRVEIDDFVISMRSFQGGLERAFATGCIRSSYVILHPLEPVNADFFGYLFKSPRYIKALQATGSFIRDGQDLNFDNFSKVDLFLPPLNEQAEIAAHIKTGCEKIDNGIAIKEEQIAALKEYKTSLINAAVTGKIKVI